MWSSSFSLYSTEPTHSSSESSLKWSSPSVLSTLVYQACARLSLDGLTFSLLYRQSDNPIIILRRDRTSRVSEGWIIAHIPVIASMNSWWTPLPSFHTTPRIWAWKCAWKCASTSFNSVHKFDAIWMHAWNVVHIIYFSCNSPHARKKQGHVHGTYHSCQLLTSLLFIARTTIIHENVMSHLVHIVHPILEELHKFVFVRGMFTVPISLSFWVDVDGNWIAQFLFIFPAVSKSNTIKIEPFPILHCFTVLHELNM